MIDKTQSPYYPVSLSTMWLKDRYDTIKDFLSDANDWNFTHIEANSTISEAMLEELTRSTFPVSSLHCPCPYGLSSSGTPLSDLSLSSTNEYERLEAIYYAKKTIERASNIGAQAVVVHLGEVPVDISLQNMMYSKYSEGKIDEIEYGRIRDLLITERSTIASSYVNAAEKSIKELCGYGRQWNIIIGIETRCYPHQIPDIHEMERFLREINDNYAGYWHDTGHAEIQQRLGITNHEDWLVRFANKLVGTHIHDVIDITDHYCPGTGTINWSTVSGYLAQTSIKVCEIGEWNNKTNMNGVIPFLKQNGIIGENNEY